VGKIPVLYTHIHRKTLGVSRTSIIVILTTVKKVEYEIPNLKLKSQTQKNKKQKKQSLPYLLYLITVTGPNPSFLHQGSLSKEWKKVTNINLNHVCGWVDGCILYIDLSIHDQQQRKKQKESRVEPI